MKISIAGRIPESVHRRNSTALGTIRLAIRAVVVANPGRFSRKSFLSLSISQPSVRLVSKARVSSLSRSETN